MFVLGVDPGLTATGFGVVRKRGNSFEATAAGVIRTDPALSAPGRLADLYADHNAVYSFGELCRQCRSRLHQAEIYESCYQCPRWKQRRQNGNRGYEQKQDYRQETPPPPPRLSRGISDLDLLGLSADAGPDEVKKAYRQIMMAVHPDKAGPATEHLAKLVNQAYQNLYRD